VGDHNSSRFLARRSSAHTKNNHRPGRTRPRHHGPAVDDGSTELAQVETLGITIVSGDRWRDEGVSHTLRMLEVIDRIEIPVHSGAVFLLINRLETIERWESLYGDVQRRMESRRYR